MAVKWPVLSLQEAGVSLIDCEHRTPPAVESGYPYIAIPQLKQGRLNLSDVRRITHEHFVEWTRKANPSPHDVIVSRRCNPGESAVASPNLRFALGQNLVLLRSDGKKVFPPFLRWLVRGPEWWEQIGKFLNVGAVFDSLKCADVPKFSLSIPPLPEQKAIAHILGTLDDKIELNRRMNETLEGMARALFKSWFVDFDPVRAKMDGRPVPGLDAWPTVQELSDSGALLVGDGYRAKRAELGEPGLPFVRAGNLKDHGFDFSNADLLADASVQAAGEKISRAHDIAFTSKGTVGRMTMVTPKTRPFVYSPQVCFWRVLDDRIIDPHVLYRWMGSPEFVEQVAKVKGQTDMAEYVSLRDQRRMRVTLPSIKHQDVISANLAALDSMIAANLLQSETIVAYRDALLPRLLSGEIRVPERDTAHLQATNPGSK